MKKYIFRSLIVAVAIGAGGWLLQRYGIEAIRKIGKIAEKEGVK